MNIRTRFSPEETRQRILDVAEEQFRRVGYAKTAVADIADALGMSPANIYRFFSSKSAINQAICARCFEECHQMVRAVAAAPGSASERLVALALALHRFNKGRYTDERRLHDMVAAAMEENWPTIEAHLQVLTALFAEIITDGIAAGEFRAADPLEAAHLFRMSLVGVLHPSLIAQCADANLEAEAERLSRFLVNALR